MKIKVCGITSLKQLEQLQAMSIDYAGLIFYAESKRYADEKMKSETLVIKNTPIKKVGVFVNANFETVTKAIDDYGLYAIQLHGDEIPEYCNALKGKVNVIKVFRMKGDESIDSLVEPFQRCCDFFLFDKDVKGYGGSGTKFDWGMLENAAIGKRFFLSGGISIDDIEKVKSFKHPYLYGIDINSRFEIEPGVKNMNFIEEFVNGIK